MSDPTAVTGTAVQEIASLAERAKQVQSLTVGARTYVDRQMFDVYGREVMPDPLEFTTLDGFAAYLLAEGEPAFVHVVSPVRVVAVSPLRGTDKSQRRSLARADCRTAVLDGFSFNEYADLGSLAIALQTCFAPTGEVAPLRKFCASVRGTQEIGVDDDGLSQSVQAKSGVAAVMPTAVSNPWMLAPWRTFAEVTQPLSPFVLRFNKEEGERPEAALFQVGDARWQVEAVKSIAVHLRGTLGPDWHVLA